MNTAQHLRPRRAFIELLRLEGQRGAGTFLITGAAIALVVAVGLVRFGTPADPLEAGALFLFLVLPLFSLPVLAIVWGFLALRDEWRDHTREFLLSLPVPGRAVLGAKVVAAGVGLGALSLLAGGVAWWRLVHGSGLEALGPQMRRFLPAALGTAGHAGWAFLSLLAVLLLLFAAAMLASVVGRTARRFGGWVTGASFLGLLFLWSLLPIAMARWVPSTVCGRGQTAGSCPLTPADLVRDVLFIGLMWWVATALLDRRIEA